MSILRGNPVILGDLNDPLRTAKIFWGNATTRAGVSLDVDQSKSEFVQTIGTLYLSSAGQLFIKTAKGTTPSAADWQQVTSYPSDTVPTFTIHLTGQTANVAATAIFTPTVSGFFKITAKTIVTSAGTTSTLPDIVITYTDADNTTAQSETLGSTQTGNAKTTSTEGTTLINAEANVAVNYATSGYASTGTAMQYSLYLTVEAV